MRDKAPPSRHQWLHCPLHAPPLPQAQKKKGEEEMLTCNKAGLISFGAAATEGGRFGERRRAQRLCDYEQMFGREGPDGG